MTAFAVYMLRWLRPLRSVSCGRFAPAGDSAPLSSQPNRASLRSPSWVAPRLASSHIRTRKNRLRISYYRYVILALKFLAESKKFML